MHRAVLLKFDLMVVFVSLKLEIVVVVSWNDDSGEGLGFGMVLKAKWCLTGVKIEDNWVEGPGEGVKLCEVARSPSLYYTN